MQVLQTAVSKADAGIVYVNQVGNHTDLLFDGRSKVLNKSGELVLELPAFEERIEYFDTQLVPAAIDSENTHIPEIELVHRALICGIRDFFKKLNFKNAVLGSSGGIDSALVQALLSEAIGAENVHAILMPSEFSSEGSVNDAVELSKNLGNSHEIVPIGRIYDRFLSSLENSFSGLAFNTTEENIQARIRAVLLMAYSNKHGNILINTSNKSEMAVGYTTLYGDMCGSLSVIGDLYKTEVYDLARFINNNKTLIPENIIEKAPSAELRPNQKDSDSLPDYSVMDGILKLYLEGKYSHKNIIDKGYEPEVVKRILRLVNNNEYKRFQAPPILRVTTKAFGRGRIIPLVSKW